MFLTRGRHFRFAYLGSGSRGNAALIRIGNTCIMLDCGFSTKETVKRLAQLGTAPEEITGVLVTHEHTDHISGVARFARRYDLPVWMTPGTHAAMRDNEVPDLIAVNCHETFAIGAISVEPLPVPHDAREPCQYLFSNGERRLGILTDTGHVTPHIRRRLDGVSALVIECNHDTDMLADGPYPQLLKERIGGRLGHLSNAQAGDLVTAMDRSGLRRVVAVHLSETNNTADSARASLSGAGIVADQLHVAEQDQVLDWIDV